MTDKLLEGLGAQAFNMAKLDLERKRFNFLVATYHEGEGLHRMSSVEDIVIKVLGANWLNRASTKDLGFAIFRKAVDRSPPGAIIIATVVNKFHGTDKLDELTIEQQREILGGGYDRYHQAVADGYMRMCDALMATVQTPNRVCVYLQEFTARGKPVGAASAEFFPQKGFGGRLKMFGEEEDRGVDF